MNKRNNNIKEGSKSAFLIIGLIILVILSLIFCTTKTLLVKSKINGDIKAVRSLNKDSYIGIIYTHSVQKTETSEWYRVDGDKLVLMEERYKSQGAGLPTETDYKFKNDKDGFKLYDINLPFEEVVYRTGAVIANHRLNIDGREEEFLNFSDPREALAFSIQKMSLLKFIVWRCAYG